MADTYSKAAAHEGDINHAVHLGVQQQQQRDVCQGSCGNKPYSSLAPTAAQQIKQLAVG